MPTPAARPHLFGNHIIRGMTRQAGAVLLAFLVGLAGCQPVPVSTGSPAAPAVSSTLPALIEAAPASSKLQTPLPPENPTEVPANNPVETEPPPEGQSPPEGAPGPTPLQRAQYNLQARLDYAWRRLQATAQISYPNQTGQALDELSLVVEANRYPGSFTLKAILWENGETIPDYKLSGNRLTFRLPQPLPPGETAIFAIAYQLDLPAIPPPNDAERPQVYGYTERQSNLVDWYPFVPPFQPGQGWLIHNPWFFGEHQVYGLADYQVGIEIFNVPPGLALTVAASAPPQTGDGRYVFDMPQARSFAWSVSPSYQVYTQTVGAVEVSSYAFPWDGTGAKAALLHTAEALALYQELFGPYPRPSLSVIEADFLDGMEYDGLYFLSRGFYNLYQGTPDSYLIAIAVHETAHQWWYGRVGNDQALQPWLDEALCTYSERLYYERYHPELLDWWWSFRVDYYQPTGWVDGRIYDYNGFTPYRNAVYLRGAQFLEALRGQIGEEVFFAFLSDYALRYTGQIAASQDFFNVLAEHTDADLQDLLGQYFLNAP